ncbi:MAG: hypothetical protein IPN33_25745 [Saprospiraceae bacterium]|nr:hypothetical protein [Saprospiraceae bacterium]
MKKYAIYSRLLWLMAILSCPTVIAGQDSGPRLDAYSRKFPFRFRIGDDSEKGNGELTLIAQYKSEAGGTGRPALKNDTAQFDFKGAKVFLLEIYLRDVNIKRKHKRNLQLKFDEYASQGKFQPVSSLPYIVELNRFKSNTTDYKLVFKILQNGEPTLVLPIQILDAESGETLGHLNAEIRVKVTGIPIPAPPDQSLCKACGNYNYDSCFLLIKKYPTSTCLPDALSKINSYDEILWAKCKGSDASQRSATDIA